MVSEWGNGLFLRLGLHIDGGLYCCTVVLYLIHYD